MYLSINPLTGKPVNSKRKLVFDEQRISYVSLAKGEKLIRDPLNASKVSVGQKLLFDPLQGKYIVARHNSGSIPCKENISFCRKEKNCVLTLWVVNLW